MKKNRRKKHSPPPNRELMSEDEAWEIALDDHPEYRRGIEDDTLPDEIVGEDGEPMSPRAHLMVHAIVERQLAVDEPRGVAEIARQLAALGVSHHEIRHVIGVAVAEQLWTMQTQGAKFDEAAYLAQLREEVASRR